MHPFQPQRSWKCGTLNVGSSLPQVFSFSLVQASVLTPSGSSQPACLHLSEKEHCWNGLWFHSQAGCFPYYNSLILAFPEGLFHKIISTCRPAVLLPWVRCQEPWQPQPSCNPTQAGLEEHAGKVSKKQLTPANGWSKGLDWDIEVFLSKE